jgi:hypothetical protein
VATKPSGRTWASAQTWAIRARLSPMPCARLDALPGTRVREVSRLYRHEARRREGPARLPERRGRARTFQPDPTPIPEPLLYSRLSSRSSRSSAVRNVSAGPARGRPRPAVVRPSRNRRGQADGRWLDGPAPGRRMSDCSCSRHWPTSVRADDRRAGTRRSKRRGAARRSPRCATPFRSREISTGSCPP